MAAPDQKISLRKPVTYRRLLLYELLPYSPKLNGHSEKTNGNRREKFYEVEDVELSPKEHNQQLEKWAYVYNYIKSHQALD